MRRMVLSLERGKKKQKKKNILTHCEGREEGKGLIFFKGKLAYCYLRVIQHSKRKDCSGVLYVTFPFCSCLLVH